MACPHHQRCRYDQVEDAQPSQGARMCCLCSEFCENGRSSFCIILLANKQTNELTVMKTSSCVDSVTDRHRRSLVLAFGGTMASAVARAYKGGLGAVPPAGSRGRAPGQGLARGSGGLRPPEAEHNYTFHKPIFTEFWCHFGKIQSFCKLLKLGLHVPWQFLM